MNEFAAIDFETANWQSTSVCSVGVVVVKEGNIEDKYYSLIHPAPNFYSRRNTAVHGLTREDTEEAPAFPTVWREILPMIKGLPLVAHNSVFDEGCLKAVHALYEMVYPVILFIVLTVWHVSRLKDWKTINYTRFRLIAAMI